ncbi:MAG: hypothetical protein M3Q07_05945 [Pseudobdellovibrionaceae bacterium]|nr:hypothetical protein [Pseudobdellovibrionaceae bacterium]
MNMMNGSDSSSDTKKSAITDATSVRNPDELRAASEELAEQVQAETLSRWSMQQALRARFPQWSEADVIQEMRNALRRVLGEEEKS